MKVGVVGTIWLNTPPAQYGGTESVVANLVDGLVQAGHDVTLFAPATANVKAKVVPTVEKPLRDLSVEWTNVAYSLLHITTAFDNIRNFDILHVHLNKSQDYVALPLALYSSVPVLFTIHFKLPTKEQQPGRYRVLTKYKKLPFTSISNSQRADLGLNFIATIYNSLYLQDYPFNQTSSDYFAWLGKIKPVKGTKEAIIAAKRAGVKLIVMGAIDEGVPEYMDYFKKEVIPLVDNKQIILKTNVSLDEKVKILTGAKALLNPILWEEPFGLVMAEAQAVGTPVIAFNRGAAPEVILNGKTGFVVDTLEEMVEKMKDVDSLDRAVARDHIQQLFTEDIMIKKYVEAYQTTIAGWNDFKKEQLEQIEHDITASKY